MSDLSLEREAIARFEDLIDLPDADQEEWIATNLAGNPALRVRVEAMLRAHRKSMLRTGGAINDTEDESVPERIGAYRVIRRIGVGGMGSVYLAERDIGDFARTVAIKVIKPGLLSHSLVERFRLERQTLANLSHPSIAQLFDGGETVTGSPYFIMEYVDGAPLLEWAEIKNASRSERTRVFRDICTAVTFAHSKLVVHRDLTPSNVLIARDDIVKLIDFGISKPTDQIAQPTGVSPSIGQLSLTPGYAAPERMSSAQVTTATDIYSLGRLLQDLMPPAPGDQDLKAIIARATAADPDDRYGTADALLADIDAWKNGYPVSAMPASSSYRLRKFVSRRRIPVIAGAGIFLALSGALAVTLAANSRAEQRFEQTRSIAKSLLFEVYDEVSVMSGATQAREVLARTGLDYLDALSADGFAPLDVRIEAGRGYLRLSQVVGGDSSGTLSRHKDGATLLAKAESIIAPLFEKYPGNADLAHTMAQILVEHASKDLYVANDTTAARIHSQRAQEIIAPYASFSVEGARTNALAIQAEGDACGFDNDFINARQHFDRGIAFLNSLPANIQSEIPVMRARSAILRLLGEAHHKLENVEEARETLDAAVQNNRVILSHQPNHPEAMRQHAIALWYQAVVHRTNYRDTEALVSIEEAFAVASALRQRDPNDMGAVRITAITGEVYAQVLADAQAYAESYKLMEEVVSAQRLLSEHSSASQGSLRSLAAALTTSGTNYYNGGEYVLACRDWQESFDLYASFSETGTISQYDQERSLPQVKDFIEKACNPPRPGFE